MNLVKFLNNLFKYDGFILVDSNKKKFVIGKPIKLNTKTIKLLDKKLNYKLLMNPDLYFGEAYTDGSLIVGSPAKAVRELSEEMKDNMTNSSKHYVGNFKRFVKEMSEIK